MHARASAAAWRERRGSEHANLLCSAFAHVGVRKHCTGTWLVPQACDVDIVLPACLDARIQRDLTLESILRNGHRQVLVLPRLGNLLRLLLHLLSSLRPSTEHAFCHASRPVLFQYDRMPRNSLAASVSRHAARQAPLLSAPPPVSPSSPSPPSPLLQACS
eukprot:4600165-Pleurochrysis_carterae.AAC.2